jgi:type VI secretion system protein ImpG
MSADRDDLLQAYQRELRYLRHAGAEFARRYPKIASRLELSANESADPHTERLIEAFAFLTARIQRQIDADLPEISAALLGVLYPYFVEPVPSMTIARFDADFQYSAPLDGQLIQRHTRLFAQTHDGDTVYFRTAYPVTLWPIEITEVRIEPPHRYPFLDKQRDVAAVLRIRLQSRDVPFSQLTLESLRLFLGGERVVANQLYELLLSNTLRFALLSDRAKGMPFYRPPGAILPAGFGLDEDLLPSPAHAHRAYRLLKEYLTFPDKFLFVDVDLGNAIVRATDRVLDLLILLDTHPRGGLAVGPESFTLGCTPVINLFSKTTEPIRVDERHTEYRLVADQRRERTTEIHSILSVSTSPISEGESRSVEPFFSFRHPADQQHDAFWYARRVPSGRDDVPGGDLLLSFVDLSFHPKAPAASVVFAHTLCTNRVLASKLPPGQVLQLEDRAPIRSVSCMRSPTAPIDPPSGGETLWRLISQLSLNHLSLTSGPESLDALREILRLHGAGLASNEQQLRGITAIESREASLRIGKDAWRGFVQGVEITLTFDETSYVGSCAILFGAVLSQFIGLYASINSFTQLVMRSEQREGTWKRWPPMVGGQPIL